VEFRVLSKWWLVGAYWVLQATGVYALTPLWLISAFNVEPGKDLGSVGSAEYVEALGSLQWMTWSAVIVSVLTGLQLIFVWPVRRPAPRDHRGWPIWVSLGIAGLAVAALLTGLLLAISQGIYTYTQFDIFVKYDIPIKREWVVGAWCLVSWGVATPLLVRFCRGGPRESLLAKVSSRLFVGTVIEIAAIIPIDVMVRRKESCYCGAGTYFGLTLCGAVGVLVLGPAVLLPLVVRRRRRWYEGKCDACGYDMRSTPKADRCPECGMGWRREGQRG
jgi:hypothetical protein